MSTENGMVTKQISDGTKSWIDQGYQRMIQGYKRRKRKRFENRMRVYRYGPSIGLFIFTAFALGLTATPSMREISFEMKLLWTAVVMMSASLCFVIPAAAYQWVPPGRVWDRCPLEWYSGHVPDGVVELVSEMRANARVDFCVEQWRESTVENSRDGRKGEVKGPERFLIAQIEGSPPFFIADWTDKKKV